jgi:AcrR family transcriptional regulator
MARRDHGSTPGSAPETPPPDATDATGVKILDATMAVLIDFGFKRATVELVAKAAGVAHTTVYRRWPTRDGLMRAAILREIRAAVDASFVAAGEATTFDDKVRTAFVEVVWSVHTHPLMTRELRTEPEQALPMLTTAAAPYLPGALAYVVARLRDAAAESGVELDDPESLADILLRLAHSLVLMPNPSQPLTHMSDVDEYARRYLTPLTRSAVAVASRAGG